MDNNMKAEIDNENKSKFFAQYWGQEVISHIGYRGGTTACWPLFFQIVREEYYLQLKSLSDISDEDAIEVYCRNLLAFPKDKSYLETKSFSNNILGIKISCRNYPYLKTEYFDINYIDIFRADYLRSRGYLVPWMGLSCEEIIEAGWAKYKE